MSVEGYLIEHCAPTLASLKTASLFSCPCRGQEDLQKELAECSRRLCPKGVELVLLRRGERSALVYVYRKGRLARELSARPVAAFLRQLGYCDLSEEGAIAYLAGRLAARGGFPHEIGLFLGYPLCDVQGFIRHAGRHCKCCGYWKVYGDEAEAQSLFQKFDRCREAYRRMFRRGCSLEQLTVAAGARQHGL